MSGQELVPEVYALEYGGAVAPRSALQNRIPVGLADEVGVLPAEFKRAWVRRVELSDVEQDGCMSDGPRQSCGTTCGCFMFCKSTDPRRVQRVWWMP